jgi:hypothetical protein
MSGFYSFRAIVVRPLLLGLCAVFLLGCGGCAILPLAALGTIFGIAGTAVSAGPEVYHMGKLDTAVMADDGACRRAVRMAAMDLRLRVVSDHGGTKCSPGWKFELEDEGKSKIEATVERRSPMLCLFRVDVGLFGSEPTARLILQVIQSHLPGAASKPSLVQS